MQHGLDATIAFVLRVGSSHRREYHSKERRRDDGSTEFHHSCGTGGEAIATRKEIERKNHCFTTPL
jgi:hypothetical protein